MFGTMVERYSALRIRYGPYIGLYVRVKSLSCVQLFVTLQTVARQAPLSLGFSRQEYWSGLPCPPPGDLPDPGIEPGSLTSTCIDRRFFTISATWEFFGPKV